LLLNYIIYTQSLCTFAKIFRDDKKQSTQANYLLAANRLRFGLRNAGYWLHNPFNTLGPVYNRLERNGHPAAPKRAKLDGTFYQIPAKPRV